MAGNFRELTVYRKSFAFAIEIFEITKKFSHGRKSRTIWSKKNKTSIAPCQLSREFWIADCQFTLLAE
jgi:hypothetical protein